MAKCPACSAPLPIFALLMHGGMLGGPHYAITCPACNRRIYVARDARNIGPPFVVLVIGLIASFPSSVSDQLLSGAGRWMFLARAEIWAVATLGATVLFSFGGRLTAYPIDQPRERASGSTRLTNLVLQIIILVWMYYAVWRGFLRMSGHDA
jgi:hypothetical protein